MTRRSRAMRYGGAPVNASSARERTTIVLVAVIAGVVTVLAWRSLSWPLGANVAVQHYIAWLIGQGYVPYRDIFDPNVPGVWLVHGVALAVVGSSDVAWRGWDLAWLAVTAITLYRYCRPLASQSSALAVALLFALYHLSGGERHAGERDFFASLPLLLGALAVASWCERDRGGALAAVAGGLALGLATTIKPITVLFGAGCVVAAAVGARSPARRIAGPVALLAGMAVPPLLSIGWLAWQGGLSAFVTILTEYTLPIFSATGRNRMWRFLKPYWLTLGAMALIALTLGPPRDRRVRWNLAVFGLVYGILHVVLQFKGTWYHFHPFALFMCAVAAPALAASAGDRARWAAAPAWLRAAAERALGAATMRVPIAVVLLAVSAALMATRDRHVFAADPVARERAERAAAVTHDLERLVRPHDTVQILDVVEGGGALALLRLHLHPANRFINDEPLFQAIHDLRIQRLRAEFMASLRARPPAAVVIFPRRWRREGYRRLQSFPELGELFAERYTLVVDRDDYKIYARRPAAARAG
jgi:hypothetical protein